MASTGMTVIFTILITLVIVGALLVYHDKSYEEFKKFREKMKSDDEDTE